MTGGGVALDATAATRGGGSQYARPVGSQTWVVIVSLAACRPSATIQQTTPVANLNTHQTAAVRVRTSAFAAQGRAVYLEQAVLANLRQRCGFTRVDGANAGAADLVIDLNITNVGRGAGWTGTDGNATIDALLVVSDGQNGDLLGTSRIRGKATGGFINRGQPENEAIDAMAKTIADVFVKSGCSGPRVARAEPEPEGPPPPDPKTGGVIDEATRAQAEALNEQGKDKIRGGDAVGALAAFQQAEALVPDPKYVLNACLTYEATEQFDEATRTCERARSMNPNEQLAAKIDQRLALLASRKP